MGVSESSPAFAPASLERFALDSSLADFMMLYGDTAFLLVTLTKADRELREGLVASDRVSRSGGPESASPAAVQTSLSEARGFNKVPEVHPSTSLDLGGLGALLRLTSHYAVTLRKRTEGGDTSRITVGRSRGCDVVLSDSRISKMHAWFERSANGTFSLADSASSNGTFIEGERLAPGILVPVPEGRTLQFADIHAFVVYPTTLWNAMQRRSTSLVPRGQR